MVRAHYRKKLNKLLGASENEGFVQLLWTATILQSENPNPARKFVLKDSIPAGAIGAKTGEQYAINKWEIETLANELMTVPKKPLAKNGQMRTLRWDHFGAIVVCTNWLRKLENVEYRVQKKQEDVFLEMGRIAARQFDWQRGFTNMPQFCRNAFVYGQGECEVYFEQEHGISFRRFSQIGFMLHVALLSSPVVRDDATWTKFGVSWDEIERVLALIALPFEKASLIARKTRKRVIHTADRPSVLRQAPCLRFGDRHERIRAPLPELILERVTSGVFYDVVSGGHTIREDYGRRFEEYCYNYLSGTLEKYDWERENTYRKKRLEFLTPDVLCSQSGKLEIAFECKATRMSQEAMFGLDPMAARGYEDLVKAVFQLWRFFSHCRRGHADFVLSDDVVGVVLTLDNWLVLAETLREHVFAAAEQMAADKEPEILEVDRKPVAFVAIAEMERTLATATESTFKQAIDTIGSSATAGWRLDSVHRKIPTLQKAEARPYPFSSKIGELLPWWDEFS